MASRKSTKKPAKKALAPSRTDPFADSLDGGDYAEAFVFENPGDVIIGKVTGVDEGYNPTYRRHYLIVTVDDEETGEPRAIHCFATALQSQMVKAAPRVGDRIGVKRHEDRVSAATGASYHDYVVRVDRPQGSTFDYSKYAERDAVKEPAPPPPAPEQDDLPF